MNVQIQAIEYYLPSLREGNDVLQKDNPDWIMSKIESKTGIKGRHIAAEDETAVDMAVKAGEKLFATGTVNKDEIDFVILITQSPDYTLPTSACVIQDRLGLKKSCLAFDINLGCSGYIYGLGVCASMIESGLAKSGLLICSETYTKYIEKDSRTCRPLFGDGAAATLVSKCSQDKLGPFKFGTDGSGCANLIVPNSGARIDKKAGKNLQMNGANVFLFTLDMVPKSINGLLQDAQLSIEDIDLFILHQASKVVLDNIRHRLNINEDKMFRNHQEIGNTVSASIPIAIKDALTQGRLKQGDKVMLVGFGVGYSWGSCLINW